MNSKTRKTWDELGVTFHDNLKEAILSFDFSTTTPVQSATIPLFLGMKDVAVQAVTGMFYMFFLVILEC